MTRWETYASLLAVVLASLSAVPIAGHTHPLLALAGITVFLGMCYMRLRRQLIRSRKRRGIPDAYERALRIQEERERKYWH